MSSNGSGDYGKVRARYNGAMGNHRVIGLATKTRYGRHKRGDVFWVHRDDVSAHPEMFTVMGDELSVSALLPKTPDDLRLDFPEPEQPSASAAQIAETLSGMPAALIDETLPFNLDEGGTPIAALGLNGRVVSTLLGAGIETVEALREAYADASLRSITGIGEKTFEEITEKLVAFNESN